MRAAFVLTLVACTAGTGAGTGSYGGAVEHAPASGEPAPSSTDPASSSNDSLSDAGGRCYACGQWSCALDQQHYTIALEAQGDTCVLNDFVSPVKLDTCGATTFQRANEVKTTFTAGPTGLHVCYELTPTTRKCVDCTQLDGG